MTNSLYDYATAVAEAKTLKEISTAKDEYIKALQNEVNELKSKVFLTNSFIDMYLTRGYYEAKSGE
jgi:glycine cleavage system pyridoxal-binding protein P